ncbi:hypothetical protein DRE_03458 [Drechslerella stenobrocha 248]|uniref:Uncharacterized protein n=1 Tax=Drechslerella stenobrocha 248 TaxID=1043628 RepID=W7HUD6_9PEZI|nr:hypothetical protein DRE_03458 [Drechslerella stenobrocha 248]
MAKLKPVAKDRMKQEAESLRLREEILRNRSPKAPCQPAKPKPPVLQAATRGLPSRLPGRVPGWKPQAKLSDHPGAVGRRPKLVEDEVRMSPGPDLSERNKDPAISTHTGAVVQYVGLTREGTIMEEQRKTVESKDVETDKWLVSCIKTVGVVLILIAFLKMEAYLWVISMATALDLADLI